MKRQCIGTHNGRFHVDEIISTCILIRLYPNVKLIRTRNQELLDKCDIIYDVGRTFNPKKLRFDHHQREFQETFSPQHKTKLSSAGLVYKFYVYDILKYYGIEADTFVINDIYEDYFEPVDANDNGIENNVEYNMRDLSNIVSSLNEKVFTQEEAFDALDQYKHLLTIENKNDINFLIALKMISQDFDHFFYARKILYEEIQQADEIVRKCYSKILILKETHFSRKTIFLLEKKHKKNFYFVIYAKPDNYRIYVTMVNKNSFKQKCPIHPDWAGLSDKKLQEVSQIPGAFFVHASCFTAGAKDLESAIEMCNLSIEYQLRNQ